MSEDWVLVDKKRDLKYKHSDVLYVDKERKLQRKIIDLAFESDDLWRSRSETKNDDAYDTTLQTDYKITDNKSLYTLRCKTIINNADIEDYYKYLRGEYDDNKNNFFFDGIDQSLCSHMKILKCIDKNHQLINSAFNSSSPSYADHYIYPRDFLYIQSRFKLDSYTAFDGELYDAVNGSLCYSINPGHPLYEDPREDCVRGNIVYGGLVLSSLDYSSVRACYIMCMDYCGDVPYFIHNNFILPYKSEELKTFSHLWQRIVSNTKYKRRENKHKDKKLNPMFESTIAYVGGNIDEVINNRNNEVIII